MNEGIDIGDEYQRLQQLATETGRVQYLDVPVYHGQASIPPDWRIVRSSASVVRVPIPPTVESRSHTVGQIAAAGRALGFDFPDSLDEAWADAEAALPEGWWFTALSRGHDGYVAKAHDGTVINHRVWTIEKGFGPTPAAALRALAVKLRERQP